MECSEDLGRLSEIGPEERLQALAWAQTGKTFPLGLEIFGRPAAPGYPDRPEQAHIIYRDWSHYEQGTVHPVVGGVASVDDGVLLNCHGGTHVDALGHIMCEGTIAGGRPASTTVGGLQEADVASLARVGIICRGVLVDLCSAAGGAPLARDHEVTVDEVRNCR